MKEEVEKIQQMINEEARLKNSHVWLHWSISDESKEYFKNKNLMVKRVNDKTKIDWGIIASLKHVLTSTKK